MGSLHGFSLLRLPLLLLVTSLVLSGVFCSSRGAPTLCDVSCCSVLPSCDNAQLVTCDCPDMDSMTLRKGNIPDTVQYVQIVNTTHVIIEKDTVSGLHSLDTFRLSGIDKVEIKQDGMASQEESELRSVTFHNIGSLRVESKAFSGVWQQNTSIWMYHIGRLNVESNALDYQVTELGPSVSLQHVEMLNLERHGFGASIFELDLYNVTMDVCQAESFGVGTSYTKLNNVTITEAKARCFYGLNEFAILHIQSLKMQTVHPQAFSGKISELTIKDSHFSTIHERGFDIRVTKMQASDSKVNDLRSNGMSVLASLEIRLEYLRINDLRREALAGLRIECISASNNKRLILSQFIIVRAENGSMAFSESANFQNLQMNYMYVMSRKTPVCPTEKKARMLTGAGTNRPLSISQQEVLSSLIDNKRCEEAPSGIYKVIDSKPLEEPLDDQVDLVNPDNTIDSPRSGADMSTALSAVDGPTPASGGVQPHESEVETESNESKVETASYESEVKAASQETEEPVFTEYREESDKGGLNGASNGYKDVHLTQVLTLGVILSLAVV